MKMFVCSIYDQASKAFSRPMFVTQVGMAVRAFQDEVNNGKSPICQHPDHYTLYEIGTFDDNTAKFESIDPVSLGNGMTFRDSQLTDRETLSAAVTAQLERLRQEVIDLANKK